MKKNLFVLGLAVALTLVWSAPIQTEAACGGWEVYEAHTYCSTPLCSQNIPSEFTEITYRRECDVAGGGKVFDYKTEKTDNGCCPNP